MRCRILGATTPQLMKPAPIRRTPRWPPRATAGGAAEIDHQDGADHGSEKPSFQSARLTKSMSGMSVNFKRAMSYLGSYNTTTHEIGAQTNNSSRVAAGNRNGPRPAPRRTTPRGPPRATVAVRAAQADDHGGADHRDRQREALLRVARLTKSMSGMRVISNVRCRILRATTPQLMKR